MSVYRPPMMRGRGRARPRENANPSVGSDTRSRSTPGSVHDKDVGDGPSQWCHDKYDRDLERTAPVRPSGRPAGKSNPSRAYSPKPDSSYVDSPPGYRTSGHKESNQSRTYSPKPNSSYVDSPSGYRTASYKESNQSQAYSPNPDNSRIDSPLEKTKSVERLRSRNKRPDMQVYVPRARRSQDNVHSPSQQKPCNREEDRTPRETPKTVKQDQYVGTPVMSGTCETEQYFKTNKRMKVLDRRKEKGGERDSLSEDMVQPDEMTKSSGHGTAVEVPSPNDSSIIDKQHTGAAFEDQQDIIESSTTDKNDNNHGISLSSNIQDLNESGNRNTGSDITAISSELNHGADNSCKGVRWSGSVAEAQTTCTGDKTKHNKIHDRVVVSLDTESAINDTCDTEQPVSSDNLHSTVTMLPEQTVTSVASGSMQNIVDMNQDKLTHSSGDSSAFCVHADTETIDENNDDEIVVLKTEGMNTDINSELVTESLNSHKEPDVCSDGDKMKCGDIENQSSLNITFTEDNTTQEIVDLKSDNPVPSTCTTSGDPLVHSNDNSNHSNLHDTHSINSNDTHSTNNNDTHITDNSSTHITDKSGIHITDNSSTHITDNSGTHITDKSGIHITDNRSTHITDNNSTQITSINGSQEYNVVGGNINDESMKTVEQEADDSDSRMEVEDGNDVENKQNVTEEVSTPGQKSSYHGDQQEKDEAPQTASLIWDNDTKQMAVETKEGHVSEDDDGDQDACDSDAKQVEAVKGDHISDDDADTWDSDVKHVEAVKGDHISDDDADTWDSDVKQKVEEVKGDYIGEDDNDDEDTWDSMFNDDGDCLDPNAMEELTKTVGKVKIQKSKKINYLDYQPKDKDMDDNVYGHIIEIFDFPAEFVTRDLISAFQSFLSRGFDLKWVDDTHALGIFSSKIAAQDAVALTHPLISVRPLSKASLQSRQKAKKCSEFLQPYKPRPETSASAARRLVAGALGLATNVSKEKRDRERQQLKEAKEKRRKDRKNREDIWEYGKCAMDEET